MRGPKYICMARMLLVLFGGLVAGISACRHTEPPTTHNKAKQPDEATVQQDTDRYAVPEGDTAKLEAFIDRTQEYKPTDTIDLLAHERKSPRALLAAARRIMELEKDRTTTAYIKAREIILAHRVQSLSDSSREEKEAVFEELAKELSAKKAAGQRLSPKHFTQALIVAQEMESVTPALAATAYRRFGELFVDSDESEVRDMAELFLGAARRFELVGETMVLTGTRMDGSSYDLGAYKGKIVLIDFWATWCGPCVAEHERLKSILAKYGARGLEIVGVSLDLDRKKLEDHLQEHAIPWPVLHSPDGQQNPAYKRLGILSVPVMILVDRDGKVLSIEARGDELDRLLAKHLPE